MSERKPIRRALISVYDKDRLLELGQALADANVEILSTGSTAQTLTQAGIELTTRKRSSKKTYGQLGPY